MNLEETLRIADYVIQNKRFSIVIKTEPGVSVSGDILSLLENPNV